MAAEPLSTRIQERCAEQVFSGFNDISIVEILIWAAEVRELELAQCSLNGTLALE
jgi:hypothetical protein